jgi:hypothetical protein
MKKLFYVMNIVSLLIFAASAFADSSGSFSATGSGATCVANPATYNAVTDTWTYPFPNGSAALFLFAWDGESAIIVFHRSGILATT